MRWPTPARRARLEGHARRPGRDRGYRSAELLTGLDVDDCRRAELGRRAGPPRRSRFELRPGPRCSARCVSAGPRPLRPRGRSNRARAARRRARPARGRPPPPRAARESSITAEIEGALGEGLEDLSLHVVDEVGRERGVRVTTGGACTASRSASRPGRGQRHRAGARTGRLDERRGGVRRAGGASRSARPPRRAGRRVRAAAGRPRRITYWSRTSSLGCSASTSTASSRRPSPALGR